jgi:hypothetical protein
MGVMVRVEGPGPALPGEVLAYVQLAGPFGPVTVPVPAFELDDLLLFPRPRLAVEDGKPVEVVLHLRCWLIFHARGLYLPMECTSADTAQAAAEQFLDDQVEVRIDPVGLGTWAAAWCAGHRDVAITLPIESLSPRPRRVLAGGR